MGFNMHMVYRTSSLVLTVVDCDYATLLQPPSHDICIAPDKYGLNWCSLTFRRRHSHPSCRRFLFPTILSTAFDPNCSQAHPVGMTGMAHHEWHCYTQHDVCIHLQVPGVSSLFEWHALELWGQGSSQRLGTWMCKDEENVGQCMLQYVVHSAQGLQKICMASRATAF